MNTELFTTRILDWYYKNKRDLPWRRTSDPFKIWLSEVIMQQTRVSQGLPYYEKFDQRFATVEELATASEEEVLQLWQGLGYYSRGRNLLTGAQQIMDQYGGKMPGSNEELLHIKGIGKYTAAAIASIAYSEPVACIDGNVYRVLSRVFGVEEDIAYAVGQKAIQSLADDLVSMEDPGGYNQAVMEFGALQCTPKNPSCSTCIFNAECVARIQGNPGIFPVKSKKVKKKDRFLNYVLFQYGETYLLKRREAGDIWQGLYDFYVLPENSGLKEEDALVDSLGFIRTSVSHISSRDYRHILSHQNILARISRIELGSKKDLEVVAKATKTQKFSMKELENLPKPVLINNYLNDEFF